MTKRIRDPSVRGNLQISEEACAKLAEATEGFIGAEIEQVVISALFEAFAESRALAWNDFARAIKSTVPLSVTQAERIGRIRAWANQRAVAASAPEEGGAARGGRALQA
jgi:SpoVK/Ycf46/Vps4 family AAA+-type ATPase